MYQQMRRLIGGRLRKARLSAKLTQQDVATDFVRSRQAVSLWETGKTLPDLLEFSELLALYGVSSDAILYGLQDVTLSSASVIAKASEHRDDFAESTLED